jgi:hypothetical protein
MSISVTPHRFQAILELPTTKPLDEAVWQAWALKGRVEEERGDAARMKALKWISLAGLLFAAAAGLWSQLTPYDAGVRLLVDAGAILLMFQALHRRDYAFGAVFGALVFLYNPVAPVFSFSGQWQQALVAVSALPFVASLTWRHAKLAPNT